MIIFCKYMFLNVLVVFEIGLVFLFLLLIIQNAFLDTSKKEMIMAEETIFSKIIRREIDADVVYQDDLVTAFRDINPQAPTHVLIIPNKLIPTVNDVTADDELTLGRMMTVAAKIAADEGIAQDGYRLIINCNRNGGQEVYHIHMHLVGGQPLGRMLAG